MIARSPMIFASAALAFLAVGIGGGCQSASGDQEFGQSLDDDRRFVIEALIDRLEDDRPYVVRNMISILWRPNKTFKIGSEQYSGAARDIKFVEARGDLEERLQRTFNGFVISNDEPQPSELHWLFLALGSSPITSQDKDIITIGTDPELTDWIPEQIRKQIENQTTDLYRIAKNAFELSALSPQTGKSTVLKAKCRAEATYGADPDRRTFTRIDSQVIFDDLAFWLRDPEVHTDYVVLALNHCFLMAMGLPAPSSPDQLWPMFQAAKAAFACARRKDVFRGEEDLDHIDQLVERLRAICTDDSPAR